ncbi:hypothetical protein Dhaf_0934 [Desulfitobacterium hafniense DCB-2]|uniref:Uncharacterized protein n=1 Tax=Desulfitobacterium hafniense (strain DSM 10664 / DCB-2) TaxID=272564 RepID=B8FYB0_DESHD|nr:hypothetical protein Dhaf_0934 [Desulfitobacterium hafniense DCB-2]
MTQYLPETEYLLQIFKQMLQNAYKLKKLREHLSEEIGFHYGQ